MSGDYSEKQLGEIQATVDQWYEAFAESPAFARLSKAHQKDAAAATDFFARYTYEYLLLAPAEWQSWAAEECLTEILPRKVSAEPSFFSNLAPVLSAFFDFLGDQALLPQGHALAKTVAALHGRIVAAANDRGRWGPAKHFVMAAHEAGVNVYDRKALEAFMLEFNLRHLARSQAPRAGSSFDPDPAYPPVSRPKVNPAVDPYAPCPCGSGKKYKFCCKPRG